MFHNAHEFHALYPGAAASLGGYCAPRLDFGYEIEAVRRKIAERAGRMVSPASSGTVRGAIDAIGNDAIEGWALNDDEPEAPVCLDISSADAVRDRRWRTASARTSRKPGSAAAIMPSGLSCP
jgi:hypothetical protein